MKLRLIILYMLMFLSIFGSVEEKYNRYFDSEIEFQLIEEYRNVFTEAAPLRYFRTSTEDYFEFVGVYSGDEWNSINDNTARLFHENMEVVGDDEIIFFWEDKKAVLKLVDNRVFIKYIRKNNNK